MKLSVVACALLASSAAAFAPAASQVSVDVLKNKENWGKIFRYLTVGDN
jgi:hypothetical protein